MWPDLIESQLQRMTAENTKEHIGTNRADLHTNYIYQWDSQETLTCMQAVYVFLGVAQKLVFSRALNELHNLIPFAIRVFLQSMSAFN